MNVKEILRIFDRKQEHEANKGSSAYIRASLVQLYFVVIKNDQFNT